MKDSEPISEGTEAPHTGRRRKFVVDTTPRMFHHPDSALEPGANYPVHDPASMIDSYQSPPAPPNFAPGFNPPPRESQPDATAVPQESDAYMPHNASEQFSGRTGLRANSYKHCRNWMPCSRLLTASS